MKRESLNTFHISSWFKLKLAYTISRRWSFHFHWKAGTDRGFHMNWKTRHISIHISFNKRIFDTNVSFVHLNQRLTRKPTFGEKEFLRITTPKPLIRYHSQTPSDFDESLGFSPNKSSEISPSPSLVPSLSGTGLRSQVIAEILMKREPQVVFPKNSKFQACVTPSNYSTSSVETHLRNRKDISPIDSCQNGAEDESQSELSQLRRMPSKPSIPRIGPFISG